MVRFQRNELPRDGIENIKSLRITKSKVVHLLTKSEQGTKLSHDI